MTLLRHSTTLASSIPMAASEAVCSLAIERGSRNALIGANGSGKTTLFLHRNGCCGRSRVSFVTLETHSITAAADCASCVVASAWFSENPDHQLFSAGVAGDVSFGPLNLGLAPGSSCASASRALAAVGMAGHAGQGGARPLVRPASASPACWP